MGTGNADHSRGLDRAEAEKIGLPELEVGRYRIDDDARSKCMRIVYVSKTGKVLGWIVLPSDEAYSFAADILRKYDRIEGLVKDDD